MDFGSLALLIGDFHTPQRKGDVPACFKELLNTDKIGMVLCTGNVGSKTQIDMLQNISGDACYIVSGDNDQGFDFPETEVVDVGDFKVGIIHGHQVIPWGDNQALVKQACKLGVDILICGHTHHHGVEEVGGKFIINPGSVTGACNSMGDFNVTPSFMLMAHSGNGATLYTYTEDENGQTKVVTNELKKQF
mmetsp:Transcript_96363/g.152370  ORF Transcript_96363/g.152370 Transcript_96363/m.152370 type:complete len:191 (+) Transcript_96363:65-637(+)|eukprot:CAMPEP_0169085262 /NCGR_PEP_ID=MMETSP1015-20121227/13064_1 /TAXON_ID=342587 /ORGANISM="Karlodinium micrum, Strain CCMP2283" /LENGTH=190 /DNA_ID=CAMNT_0009145333 /DNA_START=61 /DNA_END=633 /DNA_ORIENTATION=-